MQALEKVTTDNMQALEILKKILFWLISQDWKDLVTAVLESGPQL